MEKKILGMEEIVSENIQQILSPYNPDYHRPTEAYVAILDECYEVERPDKIKKSPEVN